MSIPIAYGDPQWIKETFGISAEELRKYDSTPDGKYAVALLADATVIFDIVRELALHRRLLGLADLQVHEEGHILGAMLRRLSMQRLTKPDVVVLCDLLATITLTDYRALKQFWGVRMEPWEVIDALRLIVEQEFNSLPKNYVLAIAAMEAMIPHARLPLPTSR